MNRLLNILVAIALQVLNLRNCEATLKVGQWCDPYATDKECPENGFCLNSDYPNRGVCVCRDIIGYGATKALDSCVLKLEHSDTCNLNSDLASQSELCDEQKFLQCFPSNSTWNNSSKDDNEFPGICDCISDYMWSVKIRHCIRTECASRVWSHNFVFSAEGSESKKMCWVQIGKPIPHTYFEEFYLECPPNSNIQMLHLSRNDDGSNAFCKCDPGFVPSSDRKRCFQEMSNGESCSVEFGDDPCRDKTGLTCSRDTHTCECGSSSKWSTEDSVCYSQVECQRRNRYSFYDSTSGECFNRIHIRCDNNTYNYGLQMFPCQKDASCSVDNSGWSYCMCNPEFVYMDDIQKCWPIKSFGESCNADLNTCNPAEHTSCQNGTCLCSEKSVWDERKQDCIALAGGVCGASAGGKSCTRRTKCLKETYPVYSLREICTSRVGQQAMDDGSCLSKYMSSCKTSEHCLPGTVCIDKVCMCPTPAHTHFDDVNVKCFGLEGAFCGSNGTVASCVSNSECVNDVCKCKEGYSRTFSWTCLLDHGQDCSSAEASCNFNQGLACVSNRCECFDSMFQFVAGIGCLGHENSPCGMVSPVADCKPGGINSIGEVQTCDQYFIQCDIKYHCNNLGNGIASCETLYASNSSIRGDTASTFLT